MRGPRFFVGERCYAIPLEFADAAYRYGHSQIRHRYQVNADSRPLPLFPDFVGFNTVPAAHTIDWGYFFDCPGRPPAQRSKKIDGRLARSLIELPLAITGDVEVEAYRSLAVRDLQRGQGLGLPSGEAVAERMGETPLSPDEVGPGRWRLDRQRRRSGSTSCVRPTCGRTGERLGPVGGRIVGEVLTTLIDQDAGSFRAVPGWTPVLPAARPGHFSLADLLVFAYGGA